MLGRREGRERGQVCVERDARRRQWERERRGGGRHYPLAAGAGCRPRIRLGRVEDQVSVGRRGGTDGRRDEDDCLPAGDGGMAVGSGVAVTRRSAS